MGVDKINELLRARAEPKEFNHVEDQSFFENVSDAVNLSWVGQINQRMAIANAQGESINPFVPYSDEGTYKATVDDVKDLPLELAVELFQATSKKEAARIKMQHEWNSEHRGDLARNDAWGAELAAGFIDPANFIPLVGMKRGLGWLRNTRSAVPGAALGIVPTEMLRHELDPTSTMTETLLGITLGTGLGAGFAGTVGTIGDAYAKRTGRAFGNYVRSDEPTIDSSHAGPRKEYTDEEFEQDFPEATFTREEIMAGDVDDGLGQVTRYQQADGRQMFVQGNDDGTFTVVENTPEGPLVVAEAIEKGEIANFIDGLNAKRVNSFNSLDAATFKKTAQQEPVIDDAPPIGEEAPPQQEFTGPEIKERLAEVSNEKLMAREDITQEGANAFHDLAVSGGTARQLGAWIKNHSQNSDLKEIIGRIEEVLPNTKVRFVTDGPAGTYDPNNDIVSIRIDPDSLLPTSREGGEEVVVHELLHAATSTRLHQLEKKHRVELTDDEIGLLHAIEDIREKFLLHAESLGVLDEKAARKIAENNREMIAYGMTNRHAREVLASIPWKDDKTLWTKFVETMRQVLGLENKSNSQLERLMLVTEGSLRRQDTPLANRVVAPVRPVKIDFMEVDDLGVPRRPDTVAERKVRRDTDVQLAIKALDDEIEKLRQIAETDHKAKTKELQNERNRLKRLLANEDRLKKAAAEEGLNAGAMRTKINARIKAIRQEIKDGGAATRKAQAEANARMRDVIERKGNLLQELDEIEAEGLSAEDFALGGGLLGFERRLGAAQMPWYRLNGTKLRELAPTLAKDWIVTARRLAGSPDLLQGSSKAGTGASVEGLAKQWEAKYIDAMVKVDQEYSKMIGGSGNETSFNIFARDHVRGAGQLFNRVKEKVGGRAHDVEPDNNPPRLAEFYDMVGEAMITGKAPNRNVKRAADEMSAYLREAGEELEKIGALNSKKGMDNRIKRLELRKEALKLRAEDSKTQAAKDRAASMIESYEKEIGWLKKQRKARSDPNLFQDDSPFFHRVWDVNRVRDNMDELREIIERHYMDHPYIIVDGKATQLSTHPDAIKKRVDDTIAQILDEVDEGDTLQTIAKRQDPDKAGLPSELIGRKLDIPNHLVKDFIVRDVRLVNAIYSQRVAPQIEMAKQFGDNSMKAHLEDLELKMLDENPGADVRKEVETLMQSTRDLRDVVLGNYYTGPDPSSMTSRTIRGLMQYNMITSMGKVLYVTLNDVGKGIMTFGISKAFGGIFRNFFSAARGNGEFKIAANEVKLAGEAHDVQTNQRAYEIMGAHGDMIGRTRAERAINNMTGATFIVNLMSPWTDHVKGTFGGMMQSRMIEDAINWDKLSPSRQAELGRIGFTKNFAQRVVDNWKAAGSEKGETMFLANTGNWADKQAVEQFRGMLADEVNRLVMTPGAATQPLFLHNDWMRLLTQYKKFSIIATQNLAMAGLQRKEARFVSAVLSMVAISALVDSVKRPDYVELSFEDALFRAVEISGVTGVLMDANQMLEGATGGEWGARAALGLKNTERDPNIASRTGALFGPVVNQWGTLTQAMVDPSSEAKDMGRALRYMVPWNNMLWWDDVSTRIQRSGIELAEDFGEE